MTCICNATYGQRHDPHCTTLLQEEILSERVPPHGFQRRTEFARTGERPIAFLRDACDVHGGSRCARPHYQRAKEGNSWSEFWFALTVLIAWAVAFVGIFWYAAAAHPEWFVSVPR